MILMQGDADDDQRDPEEVLDGGNLPEHHETDHGCGSGQDGQHESER